MRMNVYVHLKGIEKPAIIAADKAETDGNIGAVDYRLKVSLNDKEIGQFNGNDVVGWYLQYE